jgi:hypothetical protein
MVSSFIINIVEAFITAVMSAKMIMKEETIMYYVLE